MNREDTIRMARLVRDGGHWNQLDLITFAALVAAAEREACAKVCEDIEEAYQRRESMRHPALRTGAETGSGECADAIRARTNK